MVESEGMEECKLGKNINDIIKKVKLLTFLVGQLTFND